MRISVLNKKMTVIFGSPHIPRKSVVVILLLNLFLSMAGVLAQKSQIDCSKLSFSPDDLPEELREYATSRNSEGAQNFESTSTERVWTGEFVPSKRFIELASILGDFGLETSMKPQCDYMSAYSREIRLMTAYPDGDEQITIAATAGEGMGAEILIYSDETTSSAVYTQVISKVIKLKEDTKSGQKNKLGKEWTITEQEAEKYGEESTGWIIVASTTGEGYTPIEKTMYAAFRIQSAVILFFMGWHEGNWPNSYAENGNRITVLDPFTPCEDAGPRALRKWFDRLSVALGSLPSTPPTEGEPPMKISISCDREDKRYESGERVLLAVKIEKLVKGTYNYDDKTNTYRGGSYEVVKEVRFVAVFTFPNGLSKSIAFGAGDEGRIKTGPNGSYSFTPFAPYLAGSYIIKVGVDPSTYDFRQYPGITDTITFTASEPGVKEPTQEQFTEIIGLFKKSDCIPPNREVVNTFYHKLRPDSDLADMEYGAYNNVYFCKNVRLSNEVVTISNGFNCPAYTSKTLKFLTKLRFGIGYSDEERGLLRGIDYGPLVRCAGLITSLFGNEHHAVVLYNYWEKEDWAFNGDNIVLDPWPQQRPESFTLRDFCYFYARLSPPYEGIYMNAYGDPEWKEADPFWWAFPTVGGAAYWNLELKELEIKYTVPPETGTPKGEPSFPPQKPEPETKPIPLPASITTPNGRTIYECPVAVDISNDKEQHVGLVNGRLVDEIEGGQLFVNQKSETDLYWYVSLPEGKYHVRLVGIGEGDFHILTTKEGTLQYYNASTKKDDIAVLELDSEKRGEPLTLPNGEKIEPKTIILEDGGTSNGQDDSRTGDDILLGGALLAVIVIVLLLVTKRATISAYMPVHAKKGEAKPAISELRKPAEKTLTCPACANTNPSYSKYCVKCGGSIQQTSFCEECGRQIPTGSVYCEYCGDKQEVV
jgi:hypothetical protein